MQEASGSTESLDSSIEGLATTVRELSDGQAQLRDEQGRYVSTAREAANAAEVQAAALGELNSEGIQTTEQIQEQVQRLESLERIFADDARAAADLRNEQQRLQTELSEVGASAAQQHQDLSRLDQQFDQATVTMTDFTARQDMLQQQLRSTAAAQQRVASSGVTMRNSIGASASNLNIEFTQALQDAQYGVSGLANQIPLMFEQFDQLQRKAGSASGAISALATNLVGPVGLLAAGTLLVQMGPQIINWFSGGADEAERFSDKIDSAADSVFRLADASREGFDTTRQFAVSTVQQLESVSDALQTRLDQLGRTAGGRAAMGVAPGTSISAVEGDALQESIQQLEQERDINQAALDALREQLANRRAQARLLEVQRETIEENSTLTEEQAGSLQDQSATLTTITAALQQGAISRAQAAELADQRLQNADQIQASQAVLNSLVQDELITVEQIASARERIRQAAARTEPPAAPEPFGFQSAEETMFPARAARRRRRQASQAALEGLSGMSAPSPEQAESQFDALASQLGQAVQAERLGFSEVGDQIGQSMLQSARMAVVQGNISPDDFEAFKQAAEEAGIEWEEAGNQRNQQLAQSIQMAGQLGTTMVQAAQQGQVEWNQLLGSVLTTIGGIVGQGNPVLGAGIGAAGQLIGSFQSGGRVDTPFQWVGERGPELAALPQGTQVYDHDTSMRMAEAAAGRQQSVNVQVTGSIQRINRREFGVAIREDESRRDQYGY